MENLAYLIFLTGILFLATAFFIFSILDIKDFIENRKEGK